MEASSMLAVLRQAFRDDVEWTAQVKRRGLDAEWEDAYRFAMRSFRRTSIAAWLATTALMYACSDDASTSTASTAGTSGTGGTAGTSGSAGTAGTGGTSGNAGTGGTAGTAGSASDGNDTSQTAELLPRDQRKFGSLSPTEQDTDWYKFQGQAGEFVILFVYPTDIASNSALLRMELHQPDGSLWATSHAAPFYSWDELTTRLPADGEYRLRVNADCANQPTAPACAQGAAQLPYALTLAPIGVDSPAVPWNLTNELANEPDSTMPTELHWASHSDLSTGANYLAGSFSSLDDVDIARFTVADDLPPGAGSVMAFFTLRRGSFEGSGATCEVGEVRLVDDVTQEVLARRVIHWPDSAFFDYRRSDSSQIPVERGRTYRYELRHGGTASGTDDFYIFETWLKFFWSPEPVEDEISNDDPSTPTFFAEASFDNSTGFQMLWTGKLTSQGDVDHFLFVPPAVAGTPALRCSAQGIGSPIRGLSYAVLDPTTFEVKAEVVAPDTTDDELAMSAVPFVPGETMLVRVTSTLPLDQGATLPFYTCIFELNY